MKHNIKSREDLELLYRNSTDEQWNKWIESLTIDGSKITYPLYHLSFDNKLDGVTIKPRPISGVNSMFVRDTDEHLSIYSELLPDRFSMSSSLLGCWKGVSAIMEIEFRNRNISNEFEMYLYRVLDLNNTNILTGKTLHKFYLNHDAHETDEHCLIKGDVYLVLNSKLTLKNTTNASDDEYLSYYPFNDEKYGKQWIGMPLEIIKEERL